MATIMAGLYRFKDTITIPTFTNIIALPTRIAGTLTAENVENLNAQFEGTGNPSYLVPVAEYIIAASYTEWEIIYDTVAKVNLLNGTFNSSPDNEVMRTKVLPDVLYKGEGIYTSEGARPSEYMQTFQVLEDTITTEEFSTWFAESTELVPAEEGGVTIPIAERIKNTLQRLIDDTNEETGIGHSTLQAGVNTLLAGYDKVQADWDEEDDTKPSFIQNKPTIKQANWEQTDDAEPDYIWGKPIILTEQNVIELILQHGGEPGESFEQVQADWNQTDSKAVDYILNKPDIPAPQKQANWALTDTTAVDYILNKPEIPKQEPADWDETDEDSVKYIHNKPTILTENDVITLIGLHGGGGGSGEAVTEKTITLSEDLYAYAPIGALAGASDSNPKIVARKGDTLKAVFNAIFGIEKEILPTITSNIGLTVTQVATSAGASTDEVGTIYDATSTEITFTLKNSGTTNYGFRCGDAKYTGNQTFFYPIKTLNNALLKITFPSADLATAAEMITGTEKSLDGNILYCDFDNQQVKIRILLPKATISTEKQTRYGQIIADITLENAQAEDGTSIDAFLTSWENDANNTAALSGGSKSVTTEAYTVNAGRYYVYSRVGGEYEGEGPITGCIQLPETDAYNTYAYEADDYVWFYHIANDLTLQTEFLGLWGEVDNAVYYKDPVEIKLANDTTARYYVYRTGKMVLAGSAQYRLYKEVI